VPKGPSNANAGDFSKYPGVDVFDAGDLARVRCVLCNSESIRPLVLLSRAGVAPGKPEHNIAYSHTIIVRCDACGGGFIEVHEHDCFNFDDVFDRSEWFVIDRQSEKRLQTKLSICPRPLSESCTCPLHESLRATPLPVCGWTDGFETGARVQPITIVLRNGLPSMECSRAQPRDRNQSN